MRTSEMRVYPDPKYGWVGWKVEELPKYCYPNVCNVHVWMADDSLEAMVVSITEMAMLTARHDVVQGAVLQGARALKERKGR